MDHSGVDSTKSKAKSSWAKNTLVRVGSALVLIPIVLWLLFWAPPWGFVAFAILAIGVASAELLAMVVPGRRLLQVIGIALTLGIATVVLFFPDHILAALVALPAVALLANLLQPEPIESAAGRIGWLVAAPCTLGGMLVTAPLLHRVDGAWVLLAMVAAFASDTGGYFAGRLFGRHKLYERVSPKKTVEGSIGGIAAAVGGALVVWTLLLPEVPILHVVGLAAIAAACGQMGDLCESLIKRSAGVKDSGKFLPGHGGLLDRIDALMFTSVVTWTYVSHFASQAVGE